MGISIPTQGFLIPTVTFLIPTVVNLIPGVKKVSEFPPYYGIVVISEDISNGDLHSARLCLEPVGMMKVFGFSNHEWISEIIDF